MKFVFAFLIVACILLGCAIASDSQQQVEDMLQASSSGYKSDKDVSILDTVKYIKSKKYARSLQAENESGYRDDYNPRRAFWQFAIWTPIVLFVVLFFAIMSIFYMDLNKEQDTLIYAKFITSYK